MEVMTKSCKYCEGVDHTSIMCFQRPRVPIKSKKKLINRLGKEYAEWNETRRRFLQINPPTHEGYWFCHYCKIALTIDSVTVDHKRARSSHPELKHEFSNLVICCFGCNFKKGSIDYDRFMEKT